MVVPEKCPLGFECDDPTRCDTAGQKLQSASDLSRAQAAGLMVQNETASPDENWSGSYLVVCSGLLNHEANSKVEAALQIFPDLLNATLPESIVNGLRRTLAFRQKRELESRRQAAGNN
jgi:hypothetical protein